MRASATLDLRSPLLAAPSHEPVLPTLGITTSLGRPIPRGVDFVRIDASRGSMMEFLGLEQETESPAMLDLPGATTPRRGAVLTRSEFLLFAAAEGFDWVNLRDVENRSEIDQARSMLEEEVQLTVSFQDPAGVLTWDDGVWPSIDGLLLELGGEDTAPDAVELALLRARDQGVPCLLAGGLLPSLRDGVRGRIEELARLTRWVEAGCAGFLLRDLPAGREDDQLAVDILRLVLETAQRPEGPWMQRGAARVGRQVATLAERPTLTPNTKSS